MTSTLRLTPEEHTELARLFRTKLVHLRAEERRAPRKPRRQRPARFRLPELPPDDEALLTSGEVGALLGVSSQTVGAWEIPCLRTLGGHRRYRWGEVRARLETDI
jgi:hypothetical protein